MTICETKLTETKAASSPAVLPSHRALPIDFKSEPMFTTFTGYDDPRREIWDGANANLKQVFAQVSQWLLKQLRTDLLHHYELAELIKKVQDDHDKHGARRYGSESVQKIAMFFNWARSTIYSALRVARAYTRKEVEELSQLRLQDGRPFTYFHLEQLARLENREERQQFLEKTIAENLTGGELHDQVFAKLKNEKPPDDKRGRPLAVPKNLDAVIQQQENVADDFLNRAEKVWQVQEHSLERKLELLDPRYYTEERGARLKDLADKLDRLAEEAQKRAEEAHRVHERFIKRIPKPEPEDDQEEEEKVDRSVIRGRPITI